MTLILALSGLTLLVFVLGLFRPSTPDRR